MTIHSRGLKKHAPISRKGECYLICPIGLFGHIYKSTAKKIDRPLTNICRNDIKKLSALNSVNSIYTCFICLFECLYVCTNFDAPF